MMDLVALNQCLSLVSRWWTLLLLLWMVGSLFDPMSDDLFECGVGLVDSVVGCEGNNQLIVLAWDATMVQAKTFKCKLEVNLLYKHPFITSSSQSGCSAIQSQLHYGHPTIHSSI